MSNFFADTSPKYLEVPDDKRIGTKAFLEATCNVPQVFDYLSAAFKPVKSDINGNITKLKNRYDTDPAKFETLNDLIDWELAEINKNTPPKVSVIDALLWLKRGLQYIRMLLQAIVDDHKSGKQSENMEPHIVVAYEAILKQYHGWMVQKIFQLCMKTVCYRKDFFKALSYNKEPNTEKIVKDIETFVLELSGPLDVIVQIYEERGLAKYQR